MRDSMMFVIFDVPMGTTGQRREYTNFRKHLKRSGFQAIQKSIYVKHLRNTSNYNGGAQLIKAASPQKGNVLTFLMSMDQFTSIKILRGSEIEFSMIYDQIVVI